jgi:uncharacterized 2Fe-2S/4Fe-4S cluster protein (DUF4445 family)
MGIGQTDSKKFMVIFQPSGRRGYVDEGKTLKEASVALGVEIEGVCGEKATCGKCKIRVEEGLFEKYGIESGRDHLSPMAASEKKVFSPEQERAGYRLACQAHVLGSVVVFVPEESRMGKQTVRKAARQISVTLKPAVKKYYVEMSPAMLEDTRGDWERMVAELEKKYGLRELTIDYQALLTMQEVVRLGGWKVTVCVWKEKEVIKIEPGHVVGGQQTTLTSSHDLACKFSQLIDLTAGKLSVENGAPLSFAFATTARYADRSGSFFFR